MNWLELKIGDRVYLPTAYKPAPIPAIAPLQWHIAIARHGEEKTTLQRLLDLKLGLKPYVPLEHKHIAAGRNRKRDVALPMFRSYIFIPMPDLAEIWHEVRATRGVQDFLCFADRRPKRLAPLAIEAIRLKELELDAKRLQREAAAGNYPFEIGEQVWVPDLLPFQALLAHIEGYDARGRAEVVLQLEILGRDRWAIEPHRLRPID